MFRKEEASGTVVLQKRPFMRSRNDLVRCYLNLSPNGTGTKLDIEFSTPKRFALLLKVWAILLALSIVIQFPGLLLSIRKEDPTGAVFMTIAIPIVVIGWLYMAFGYRLEWRQRFFLGFLKKFLKAY